MSDIKKALIQLGHESPDLRDSLRHILASLPDSMDLSKLEPMLHLHLLRCAGGFQHGKPKVLKMSPTRIEGTIHCEAWSVYALDPKSLFRGLVDGQDHAMGHALMLWSKSPAHALALEDFRLTNLLRNPGKDSYEKVLETLKDSPHYTEEAFALEDILDDIQLAQEVAIRVVVTAGPSTLTVKVGWDLTGMYQTVPSRIQTEWVFGHTITTQGLGEDEAFDMVQEQLHRSIKSLQ
jgi:hypothetical protein